MDFDSQRNNHLNKYFKSIYLKQIWNNIDYNIELSPPTLHTIQNNGYYTTNKTFEFNLIIHQFKYEVTRFINFHLIIVDIKC